MPHPVVQPELRRHLPADEIAALAYRHHTAPALAEALYECVELDNEWAYLRDERRAPYLELAHSVLDHGTPEPLEEYLLLNSRTSVTEGRHFTRGEALSARSGGQEVWRSLDGNLEEHIEI